MLMSQSAYARQRGITHQAVSKRTATVGGPIPVHGPKKLIDPAEADALWEGTKSAQGAGGAEAAREAPSAPGSDLARARAAAVIIDVQTKRLNLEQRRGALISKDRATLTAFSFARTIRDACQAWPSRVGPALAAQFELDPAAVTVALDEHMRALLEELASERVEF
jgi:hypothetical protein